MNAKLELSAREVSVATNCCACDSLIILKIEVPPILTAMAGMIGAAMRKSMPENASIFLMGEMLCPVCAPKFKELLVAITHTPAFKELAGETEDTND